MTKVSIAALILASLGPGPIANAQHALTPTQILVAIDGKSTTPLSASVFTVDVNGRKEPLQTLEPLLSSDAQVALLIDDGLRETVGREMDNLKNFVRSLPAGVQVMVGFMQFGRVVAAQSFTADHDQAAASLHLPQGVPGASASPYVCLSDFVKNWPDGEVANPSGAGPQHARLVLMISNGVDPYNGSTSIMNQDSPYVSAAVTAAQRAGVSVSAIYFADAGISGSSANDSGQNYLSQVASNTGGVSYWQGVGSPVSLEPYLKEFQQSLARTYVAGFLAPSGGDAQQSLVRVKVSAPHVKLHAPSEILPGNRE